MTVAKTPLNPLLATSNSEGAESGIKSPNLPGGASPEDFFRFKRRLMVGAKTISTRYRNVWPIGKQPSNDEMMLLKASFVKELVYQMGLEGFAIIEDDFYLCTEIKTGIGSSRRFSEPSYYPSLDFDKLDISHLVISKPIAKGEAH